MQGKGNPRELDFEYTFSSGLNTVSYYLEASKVKIGSNDTVAEACRVFTTIEVDLIDLPHLEISTDTVCAQEIITVTNLSEPTAFSGNITDFQVLEDDEFITYPNTHKSWEATYEFGGLNEFTLVARTDSGLSLIHI